MSFKRRLAASIAVAALLGVPVASASAASTPLRDSSLGAFACPDSYVGAAIPLTGCAPWLISNPGNLATPPVSNVATPPVSNVATPPVSSMAPPPVSFPGPQSLGCPANYVGPTNPATGCPPWMMIYSVPGVGTVGG
jgi:hypothetical protein